MPYPDIYITDYASHSVLKVTKSKNMKKFVYLRKRLVVAWLPAMAPYMIVGDNANGILCSINWWADLDNMRVHSIIWMFVTM